MYVQTALIHVSILGLLPALMLYVLSYSSYFYSSLTFLLPLLTFFLSFLCFAVLLSLLGTRFAHRRPSGPAEHHRRAIAQSTQTQEAGLMVSTCSTVKRQPTL